MSSRPHLCSQLFFSPTQHAHIIMRSLAVAWSLDHNFLVLLLVLKLTACPADALASTVVDMVARQT
jgi:hypothetical protein